MTPDFHFAGATMGFNSGSTSFGLPLVACNNNGFNTFFSIQNAGSADANVTVTYIPGGAGLAGKTDVVVLHVGQSKTFDQAVASTSGTKTCNDLKDGSGKFVGAASITSDQPIVADGYYLNTTTYQALSGFNGFSAGATTVVAPLIMANNSNYWSSIQIQNFGSGPTNVTIKYGTNQVSGGYTPTNDTCPALAAHQSCTKLQSGGQWLPATKKYVGSATITSSSQPIVVLINIVNLSGGATNTKMDAYDGFDPSVATNTLDMPLMMSNNGGWFTSFQMMNVGTGSCAVKATYSANTAGAFSPVAETFTLAVNATKTVFQNGASPNNGSLNTWTGVGKYVGSATAVGTGAGCKIIAVVNQLGTSTYDQFMSYDAFNR
jgi:hypothetical protein